MIAVIYEPMGRGADRHLCRDKKGMIGLVGES